MQVGTLRNILKSSMKPPTFFVFMSLGNGPCFLAFFPVFRCDNQLKFKTKPALVKGGTLYKSAPKIRALPDI